jgi:hypothetical protein
MPNQLPEWVEHRILAFSLAHPGLGPKRISAELARVRWGSLRVSPNGVWRCLSRHGLGHRRARLSLVAGYAAPPEPGHEPEPERHLDAPHPGALVGMDCFYVGRLSGTKGVCWQYTAIDVHSGFTWAELHTTDKNPAARLCSALARRVAHDLAAVGWRLEVVTTDIQPESAPQVLGSLGRRHEDREDRRPSTVVDDRSERTARLLAC